MNCNQSDQWKVFFENAEKQFIQVVMSAKLINEKRMLLPYRFNQRTKIYYYFRRYWSKKLTLRMLCNLRIRKINNKLYLPAGDPGIFPNQVNSIKLLKNRSNEKVFEVKFGWRGFPTWLTVMYQVKKNLKTNRYEIVKRESGARDYRYASCKTR